MNYMEIERASVSNGTGFRVVLYVAGCTMQCPHCHNPEAWDFNAGKKFTEETKEKLFEAINKEWVAGVTFTGGHPLEEPNREEIASLIYEIRERFPDKNIWLYTGYDLTVDDFLCSESINESLGEILCGCDVVVDGRYINEKRDITLPFKGSTNQKIIDVAQTIKYGNIVEKVIR